MPKLSRRWDRHCENLLQTTPTRQSQTRTRKRPRKQSKVQPLRRLLLLLLPRRYQHGVMFTTHSIRNLPISSKSSVIPWQQQYHANQVPGNDGAFGTASTIAPPVVTAASWPQAAPPFSSGRRSFDTTLRRESQFSGEHFALSHDPWAKQPNLGKQYDCNDFSNDQRQEFRRPSAVQQSRPQRSRQEPRNLTRRTWVKSNFDSAELNDRNHNRVLKPRAVALDQLRAAKRNENALERSNLGQTPPPEDDILSDMSATITALDVSEDQLLDPICWQCLDGCGETNCMCRRGA